MTQTSEATQRPVLLVVDDDPMFLRLMCAILQRPDGPFEVHTADTGEEAMAFLLPEPPDLAPRPDLVVLDYHLVDATALAVLERLRAAGWHAAPVLVLSACYWPEDEAASLAAGAGRFLEKPSDPDTLRTLVMDFWQERLPDVR